jgi:hypothetical protein
MSSPDASRRRSKKDSSSPKSKDKDRDRDRDRDRERHKSSKARKPRSSASRDDDTEGDRPRERPSGERLRTSSSSQSQPQKMAVVPEMQRRGSIGSANSSRISFSYPTLSKTHAKESIYAREEPARRSATMTPQPTDVDEEKDGGPRAVPQPPARVAPTPPRAPPSPPLTATTAAADLRKTASANSMRRKNADELHRA